MPSVCRRIAVLLAVSCLGVALPVSVASAQDAGDQQYQDPFGGSTKTTQTAKPKAKPKPRPTTTTSTDLEPLSPSPQTGGQGSAGGSSANAAASATATAPASASSTRTLPNTGLDARVVLLAGAALLITGLGLRLRTVTDRS